MAPAPKRFDELTDADIRRIDASWKSGIEAWCTRMDDRIRVIERLVWIATGGVLVVGGIVSVIGNNILKLLAH